MFCERPSMIHSINLIFPCYFVQFYVAASNFSLVIRMFCLVCFRLEFEYVAKGFIFRKGRIKVSCFNFSSVSHSQVRHVQSCSEFLRVAALLSSATCWNPRTSTLYYSIPVGCIFAHLPYVHIERRAWRIWYPNLINIYLCAFPQKS
jgi:hypothetical protein